VLLKRSPQTLWETALGQLELQVTRPNFETWLRNTAGLSLEGEHLVVGVPSDFALEWLRSRLSSLIARTVSQLLGCQATISFQVLGAQVPTATPADGRPAASPLPVDLDRRLTFDSFTVTKGTQLAYRAARRAASGRSDFNPLVLFGPPGVGKTHLLHAIGNAAEAGRRLACLTGEAFVDRYTKATRAGQPHVFRDAFDHCDLFLLDDLAFLAGAPGSQQQFFHIFNSLHTSACLFVVTLDTRPEAITAFSPPLRSRLQSGLSAELVRPTPEEALLILRAKASRLGRRVPANVLEFLAGQPFDGVRELEGALHQVIAYSQLANAPITQDLAREAIHVPRPSSARLTAEAVLRAVCQHFRLSQDQLTGKSRARDITYPRHVAIYLLRQLGTYRLTEIGRILGGRDHSTVFSAYNRIRQERQALPQTRTDLEQIEQSLRTHSAA
jgi:chromosomal replication initiator protein